MKTKNSGKKIREKHKFKISMARMKFCYFPFPYSS